jgi:hypothetical protein
MAVIGYMVASGTRKFNIFDYFPHSPGLCQEMIDRYDATLTRNIVTNTISCCLHPIRGGLLEFLSALLVYLRHSAHVR